ncbi:MAG: hypothetical protein IPN19_09935 [Elusimicrobia bacterium]|nr:hypothetical protein [Elusimicrobiota bacterium]
MSLFFSVSGIRRRWSVFALSVIFFGSNVLAVHAGEASFWAERRNVSRRMHGVEAKSGATGFGLTAEQYQTLTQLPKAGQLNPGSIQGGSSVGSGRAVSPPCFERLSTF